MADTATPDDVSELVLYEPPPPRRSFSAGEWLRLLIGASMLGVGLLLVTVAEDTISGAESDLVEGFSRLPDRAEEAIIGVAQLGATLVPLAGLVVVLWRRRWLLLLQLWLASTGAGIATVWVANALGERESSIVLAERTVSNAFFTDPQFPTSPYLASAAAVVSVASPWMSRRWKRAFWTWVIVLVALRILGSVEPGLDVVLAVAIGVVVGSVIVLVLGAPNPEPRPMELVDGLRACGIQPSSVERAPDTSSKPHFLVHEPGQPVRFVKVRTPDDRSSDLLNRLYRAIRLRPSEVERPYSTLKRRVEHEALVLLAAAKAGARCPSLVALGETDGGSAFLVLERIEGIPAVDVGNEAFTDELLTDLWTQVAALHRSRISHRELALDNVLVDSASGTVWLVDMEAGQLAGSELDRGRDVAELLVDLTLLLGPDRAVDSAAAVLGPDEVALSLRRLQPLALSPTIRRRLRADKGTLERLRSTVEDRTGVSDIKLDQIERVSPRTVVMIGAATLAFYALLPQLANVGETVDAFGRARWVWVPAILAASASTFLFATISLLGSLADPIPVPAAARSTVASSFAALVGPATTGRMALAIRFLQRAGIEPADASAATALNSAAGLIMHLLLMLSFFAWTGGADVGGFSLPDSNAVLLVLAVLAAVVAVAMLLGPVRRRVLTPTLTALRQAQRYVVRVMRSPLRIIALLGGSSLITLSYVTALIFSIQAFGGGLSIPQIGASYLGAAAIANLAPTPGGLGALEAAMIAALTGFGLNDAEAVSSVLTFRLATYWLPILPGWLTLLWMQRNDEI
jgi:undecaprenyl-diphosphatase